MAETTNDDENASLELVREMLMRGGFRGVTVAHGPARVNDLLPLVFSNGGRHVAIDSNHFLLDDPIVELGVALRKIMSDEELRDVADRMARPAC